MSPSSGDSPTMRNEVAQRKKSPRVKKSQKVKDVSYEIHVTSGAKKGSAVVDAFGKILKRKSLHLEGGRGEGGG